MMKYVAETVGTFMLVLVGAGSITLALPHLWISVAFGVIVTLMILCFGKTSGAHINPAVSLGFYIVEKDKSYLNYILFQLIGGGLAAGVLFLIFPSNPTYGETLPGVSIQNTFLIEIGITFVLMLSILLIIRTNSLPIIAIVVGLVVFLAAFFVGPYTGASMNPARSFGPNLVSGNLDVVWIYFLAPFLGASLASIANKLMENTTK